MQRIHDYAIIGDCRSAALISREGSIDWLCWPRFDSPSIFGALLDAEAGHWRIAPTAPFKTERRYMDETNILETRFQTETDSILLIDLMPVASEEDKENSCFRSMRSCASSSARKGEVEVRSFRCATSVRAEKLPAQDDARLGLRLETGYGLSLCSRVFL